MKLQSILTFILIILTTLVAKEEKKEPVFPVFDYEALENRVISVEKIAENCRKDVELISSAQVRNSEDISSVGANMDDVSPARLEELEVTIALLTEAFKDLYAEVAAIKVLPQIKFAKKAPKKPDGFSASSSTKLIGGKEYELYSRGLDSYRKGFFLESTQFMKSLLEQFEDGDMCDRAQFWIGESLFKTRNFNEAILEYTKVENYPSSSKLDDAVYKIALSYYKLGENDVSLEKLNFLIKRYPASEYIKSANNMIKKLGVK
jgi:TolA-binding protein